MTVPDPRIASLKNEEHKLESDVRNLESKIHSGESKVRQEEVVLEKAKEELRKLVMEEQGDKARIKYLEGVIAEEERLARLHKDNPTPGSHH
ncbi:MAG: hypothetical protein Q7S72_01005 [Candidatus Taylorbacteria bacterium]|nr:hypothetical protein [Candidatus Taylorbacteria bacterium]